MALQRALGGFGATDRQNPRELRVREHEPATAPVYRFGAFTRMALLAHTPLRSAPLPTANGDAEVRTLFDRLSSMSSSNEMTAEQARPVDEMELLRARFLTSAPVQPGTYVWEPDGFPVFDSRQRTALDRADASAAMLLDRSTTSGGCVVGRDMYWRTRMAPTFYQQSSPAPPRFDDASVFGVRRDPPIASVIWALVENQNLTAARKLLAELPDEPQYLQLRTLLRPPTTSKASRRDRERGAEYQWLREHASAYRGRWVAILGNELVASAATLRELRNSLRSTPLPSVPLVHFVE